MAVEPIRVRGRLIRQAEDGFVCVTDIHNAAGFTKNQKPGDFIRLPQALAIMPVVHDETMGKSHSFKMSNIWRARGGRDGGTYAHPLMALAYAEYLSPKLAVEVKQVFLRYRSGDASLADEVLERSSPEANEWAGRRAITRAVRNQFTSELDRRGVRDPKHYAICTNATYKKLFDGTAKQIRVKRGLPEKASIRDNLNLRELAFLAASEALSVERMEDEDSRGFNECHDATSKSAESIRAAIEMDRKSRKKVA